MRCARIHDGKRKERRSRLRQELLAQFLHPWLWQRGRLPHRGATNMIEARKTLVFATPMLGEGHLPIRRIPQSRRYCKGCKRFQDAGPGGMPTSLLFAVGSLATGLPWLPSLLTAPRSPPWSRGHGRPAAYSSTTVATNDTENSEPSRGVGRRRLDSGVPQALHVGYRHMPG